MSHQFVTAEAFSNSQSRVELWDNWILNVCLREALMRQEPRTWMAGSFVSSKLNPPYTDVFYGFTPGAFDALDGEDLAYLRQPCTREPLSSISI